MQRKVWLLAALGAAARPALAQDLPAAPPFSLGLQAALYPQVALVPAPTVNGRDFGRPWPVLLKAGYQFRRWGVEGGLLLRLTPETTSRYADAAGTQTKRASGFAWAVPVVARWRLSRMRATRWQLDAEAGVMLTSSRLTTHSTYQDASTGQQSDFGTATATRADLPLLLGAGVTYRLTPQLGLTADARLAWSWLYSLLGQLLGGRSTAELAPACSLGAAYSFGRRRGHR